LPQGPRARKRGTRARACGFLKKGRNQPGAIPACFSRPSCGPILFPISSPSAASALMGRNMTLEFDPFASLIEPDEIDALELPAAPAHVFRPSVSLQFIPTGRR